MISKNQFIEYEEVYPGKYYGTMRSELDRIWETQKHILSLARQAGFILKGKIDMVGCQYEYQYIYILSKPN